MDEINAHNSDKKPAERPFSRTAKLRPSSISAKNLDIPRNPTLPVSAETDAEHKAWLAKYTPFERKIFAERERRWQRKRQARAEHRYCSDYISEDDLRHFYYMELRPIQLAMMLESFDICSTLLFYALKIGIRRSTLAINRYRAYLRRPVYYARENERRRLLAASRRKITQRTTSNPCPTKEQILDAFLAVKTSHEAVIRFGSLIEDLECYLDNSLRRNEKGEIVGRNSGIKGWLQENIPALYLRYTTVMRYKAAAKKLRQIAELHDPTPAAAIFAAADAKNVPELALVKAMAIWQEVTKGVAVNPTALVKRIDDLVDPERIEDANMLDAWRKRYAEKITERTKERWWRKVVS